MTSVTLLNCRICRRSLLYCRISLLNLSLSNTGSEKFDKKYDGHSNLNSFLLALVFSSLNSNWPWIAANHIASVILRPKISARKYFGAKTPILQQLWRQTKLFIVRKKCMLSEASNSQTKTLRKKINKSLICPIEPFLKKQKNV